MADGADKASVGAVGAAAPAGPAGLVYEKIARIMKAVGPIAKRRTNEQQHYRFRGIEDVYKALQKIMAEEQVFTVSQILWHETKERRTKSGGTAMQVWLGMRYRFCAVDGSSVATEVVGEGYDTTDKSAAKAMSLAHKAALLQAFMIPTEDAVNAEKQIREQDEPGMPQRQRPEPQQNGRAVQQSERKPQDEWSIYGQIMKAISVSGDDKAPLFSSEEKVSFKKKADELASAGNQQGLSVLLKDLLRMGAERRVIRTGGQSA